MQEIRGKKDGQQVSLEMVVYMKFSYCKLVFNIRILILSLTGTFPLQFSKLEAVLTSNKALYWEVDLLTKLQKAAPVALDAPSLF